jgi:hypothetical protein
MTDNSSDQILTATMDLDGTLAAAPQVLEMLTRELLAKSDAAFRADKESQLTACLHLALRSASMMYSMSKLLDLSTTDAYETLNRAAIEARDLLMHFRFNDADTKKKIGYWFAGAKDNAWKADHNRLDQFLARNAVLLNTNLGESWSKMSVLAHPTRYAADNSTVTIVNRLTGRFNSIDREHLTMKRADYVVGIARLFMATVWDLKGWTPLGLDIAKLGEFHQFCINAEVAGNPILNGPNSHLLPDHSIRPPKQNA